MSNEQGRIRGFTEFMLTRRITVLMLVLSVILVGVVSYVLVPLELLPAGYSESDVDLWIPVSNSNPVEVLNQVLRPTEEQLRTVPGVQEIRSRASSRRARFSIEFGRDVDVDLAVAEIRDRVERARPAWPEDVREYRISRFNSETDMPIMAFAVDLRGRNDSGATFYIEQNVLKRIEALPGVASVECWGILDDQVRIDVNLDKAAALGIRIYQLTQRLAASNLELSGGEIEDKTTRFTVKTDSRFRTLEDLRTFPVTDDGVQLKEIADVFMAKGVRSWMALSRNERSLWCQVFKESTANTVATANAARALLNGEIGSDPVLREMNCRIRTYDEMDSGLIITSTLDSLRETAVIGAGLALIILLLFLRRPVPTILITAAIPLSLLLTMGWIYFSGNTLNMFSMVGITISIGMLIDNAIVVVENIYRHRDLGRSPWDAARIGASEVGLAITLSTLTTLAAFLPIMFMTNVAEISFMTQAIGLPLCVAVLSSLLVALVFIPIGTVVFSREMPRQSVREPRALFLDPVRNGYAAFLGWALRWRFPVLVVGIFLIGFLGHKAFKATPMVNMESDRGGEFSIGVDMDQNFSLSDAYKEMKFYGAFLEERMEEFDIGHYWCFFRRTGGRMRVNLNHQDLVKTRELAKHLKKTMPVRPGVHLDFRIEDGSPKDSGKLTLDIYGPDPERLMGITKGLMEHCEKLPGVLSITSNLEDSNPEVHIIPDREQTARLGVDPRTLRGTLTYGVRGWRFSDLLVEEQEIPLIIEYDTASTIDLQELRELQIPTERGGVVPLSNIAAIEVSRGLGEIRRTDGQANARLTIDTGASAGDEVTNRLRAALAGYPLPEGYRFQETSQDDLQESIKEIAGALLLSIVFIFLLMGVLFESVILPLAVIITVGLSFAGAIWSLFLTGISVDILGMISVVVLAGVVVNNGIVLMDRIQKRMADGTARREAVIEACRTRFRPILMTSATTIMGLLPMAVRQSGSQISYQSLSVALVGGLTVATVFTPLFVPLLFTVLDDLRKIALRAFRSLFTTPQTI